MAAFLHSIETGEEAPMLAEDLKFQVRGLMGRMLCRGPQQSSNRFSTLR